MLKARRAVAAYLVLAFAVTFAIWKVYDDEQLLCRESHRRYDTLTAVIVTSTTPRPFGGQPPTKQLTDYYAELRGRLLETLGKPPTC